MRTRSGSPGAGLLHGGRKLVWLGFVCLTMSASLYMPDASAEDYLTALDAEASEVRAVEKKLPDAPPPAQKSEKTTTEKDPYLSALEEEADDLESQQSKKMRDKNTAVKFSHIRF